MKIKAYSKVTLVLKIYKKNRLQPKHKINAIFAIHNKLFDEISIKKTCLRDDKVVYYNNKKIINIPNCNVKKILVFLRQKFNIPFYHIEIQKNIPIGSGLGGSAADAGNVAKHILKTLNIPISRLDLKKIALEIGSDIPFFLYDYNLATISEFGNYVKPISQTKVRFNVVLTNIKIDTTSVYKLLEKDKIFKSTITTNNMEEFLLNNFMKSDVVFNDLQKYAFKLNKKLELKYNALKLNSSNITLSGSGGSFVSIRGVS